MRVYVKNNVHHRNAKYTLHIVTPNFELWMVDFRAKGVLGAGGISCVALVLAMAQCLTVYAESTCTRFRFHPLIKVQRGLMTHVNHNRLNSFVIPTSYRVQLIIEYMLIL